MKRSDQRSKTPLEGDPTFEQRGALTAIAQKYLDLPSQAQTDEEKLARRLARARRNRNLLHDSGSIVLPDRIPLATIRQESFLALQGFQRRLEEEQKRNGVDGIGFPTTDFIETIKDHIGKKARRPSRIEELADLPYFDWRLPGIVTQPRNQAPCGSCWAHAATEAFESRLMYNVNRVRVVNRTEDLGVTQIALSVQGVLDCVTTGSCHGGSHTDAFSHFVKNGARLLDFNEQGISIHDDFPATDEARGPCLEEGGKGIKALTWDFAFPRNPLLVARGRRSIRWMKVSLLNYGAMAVNLTVDRDSKFHNYRERKYSRGVYDVDCRDRTNHNALLTGWDDERDAWIIANSFGADWGGSCIDIAKVRKHFPWTVDNAHSISNQAKGCMYIKRGYSKIGELAAWIETHLDNEDWLEKARIEKSRSQAAEQARSRT